MADPFLKPEHVQGSQEWLAHRKNYIGASDAPIIMGLSPWCTPYELWQRKLGLIPEQEQNYAMTRGSALEPESIRIFQEKHGIDVFPAVIYHKEHSFLMASLDGISLDRKTCCEVKNPMGVHSHNIAMSGNVPDMYFCQVQMQMACEDMLDMIHYQSTYQGNTIEILVYRDEEYIKSMTEKLIAFWEKVLLEEPPELTDKDYEDRSSPTRVAYGSRIEELDHRKHLLKAELKDIDTERDFIRDLLIEDANGRNTRGGGLLMTRTYPKGRVDYSAIPELEDVDLEQYRKPSRETWTMRLKK